MNVFVFGLPGSGKSYFAERLAKSLDAEYVNSDRLRKELFPKRTYSNIEKSKVYNMMLQKTQEANGQKKNMVLDATFHKKESREPFTKNIKGKVHFIEVWADEHIIKERLKKGRPYSEADFKVHQLIRKEWEPMKKKHLRLESTNDNITVMLEKAFEYLKHDGRRDI